MAAGLILAAGAGTRFGGRLKLLATLHDRPLLQWAVDAQVGVPPSALARIVVVLGACADEVAAAIDFGRAEAVVCGHWKDGQSASLRCGLRALAGEEKVVVTLGDAPLVDSATIARFAREPAGTRAVYDGRPGHPVVLGSEHVALLLRGSGDQGARELLRDARVIELGPVSTGRDVDTPSDLRAVAAEASRTRPFRR